MTIDLDDLEDRAKHQLQGPCTGMAHEVLELIAELRVKNNLDEVNEWTEELEKNALRDELKRARAERDWLAETLENHVIIQESFEKARLPRYSEAEWLRRAKKAVESEIDHD